MGPTRLSLKRSLLLSTFAAFALFSATGFAQNDESTSAGNTASSSQSNRGVPGNTRSTSSTSRPTQANTLPPQASITGGPQQSTGGALPTGLPTLTNAPLIISYPPPSVPPTVNAPFMHRSSAPDGTVFIAVGAILGAFGAALLIWRAIIACLLHRSVERAAMAQHVTNDKASFPAPPAPFYKYTDRDSSPSLAGGAAGRGVRRTNRGPVPSSTPSQSNLFFSPTAQGSGSIGGGRDSRFLPSGFYAAGASSPANAHGASISLTNLRPDSRGQYGGAASRNTMRDPSPPESPLYAARRDLSTSTLNLNRPPSQRAPSAYLEDLLDENPNALPPANTMPPSVGVRHAHTFSQASQAQSRASPNRY